MEPYRAAPISDALPGGSYRTEYIRYVDDHLRWMRKCGRADTTLKARRRSLTLLAEHLGHDPFTASLDELERWQDTLPSLGSVRHQTELIRPYFAWLHARGHRADNPAALLPVPKKPKRLARPISEDHLMAAVAAAPVRELPWLLLAGWTGMRASDIAGMRRENIHVDLRGNRFVRVVGKGDVERDVAVPAWVWERVEPLMWAEGWCWRRERGPGKGVDPRTAQHISQYCNEFLHKAVGIPSTLHSLRHRVGTLTLDDTGNARVVQDVLGHADLAQVQTYTRIAGSAKSEAVDRLPRPAGAPPRPAARPSVAGGRELALSEHELDAHQDAWLATYRSEESRSGYRRDVDAWRRWCVENKVRLHEARRSDAERYRVWLETGLHPIRSGQGHYKPATVIRRLDGASSFYRYLSDEGLVSVNPFRRVTKPPLPLESDTPCLTRDEAAALVVKAEETGRLELAMVWVLLATGLRVSELCNADLADLLDTSTGMHLSVTRKGGRAALISLPGPAGDAMRVWLAERPRTASKALMLRGGLRLHRRRVHTVLVRLCAQAAITRVSAHGLRHTVATLLLDDGVSIWDVQAHLGHRRTETTLRYDRSRRARAGAAAAKLVEILAAPPRQAEVVPLDLAVAAAS